jgi:hypothetical protein
MRQAGAGRGSGCASAQSLQLRIRTHRTLAVFDLYDSHKNPLSACLARFFMDFCEQKKTAESE